MCNIARPRGSHNRIAWLIGHAHRVERRVSCPMDAVYELPPQRGVLLEYDMALFPLQGKIGINELINRILDSF